MFIARVISPSPDGPELRIVVTADPAGRWTDVRSAELARLRRRGAAALAARRLAEALVPTSLSAALSAGAAFDEVLNRALSDQSGDALQYEEPQFAIPVDPPAIRDFMAFERHFRFGSDLRGIPVPDVLYQLPVSYFGNPSGLLGPGEELAWPHYSSHLDYELELGIVLGRGGRNIRPEKAEDHIFGLTIFNDFSARDMQRREMEGGLGPSKGKHFGTALGPWIATLDEIPTVGVKMRAYVNGELWSDAVSSEMIWSIGELVAWSTAAEEVAAGTVLGTGTANAGSAIELGRKLSPGDEIKLVVDHLGTLVNRLGEPGEGWLPSPRQPTVGAAAS